MTSLCAFRPLSHTHLHGDWNFFFSNSTIWLPHGRLNHIVYGKPSVVWYLHAWAHLINHLRGAAESTAAWCCLLQW